MLVVKLNTIFFIQIPQNTAYHRAQKSAQLRRDMASPDFDATVMRVIFIDLPPTDKHNFHIMGDVSMAKHFFIALIHPIQWTIALLVSSVHSLGGASYLPPV